MLEIHDLETGYGETQIIHGLNLKAGEGRLLAVLGRNGAGKTTTLKSIMGLLRAGRGSILFRGENITRLPPFVIARMGIAYVPETRDIFPSLTVEENLALAARLKPAVHRSKRRLQPEFGKIDAQQKASAMAHERSKCVSARGERRWTMERVLAFFPRLGERLRNGGNQLSGGEQQMLAIARALLTNPLLLLLDEPTEGLAPIIVKQIHDKLAELKAEGLTIVLVEQNFGFATSLADDVIVIGRGRAVWSGQPEVLRSDTELQSRWLGV